MPRTTAADRAFIQSIELREKANDTEDPILISYYLAEAEKAEAVAYGTDER